MKLYSFDYTIYEFPVVSSTNSLAIDKLAAKQAAHADVFLAQKQHEGKGLGTNKWFSEDYKNLIFSFVLSFDDKPEYSPFWLNKLIAISLRKFAEELTECPVSIKWPNDIYVNDRKLAGVLIENRMLGQKWEHAVVGIGFNLNQIVFPDSIPKPVSVAQLRKADFDVMEQLKKFLDIFKAFYPLFLEGRCDEIDSQYHSSLYRIDEFHEYELRGEKMIACIKSVDEYGFLHIQNTEGKEEIFDIKEVVYL